MTQAQAIVNLLDSIYPAGLPTGSIASRLGFPAPSVRRTIQKLENSGKVSGKTMGWNSNGDKVEFSLRKLTTELPTETVATPTEGSDAHSG